MMTKVEFIKLVEQAGIPHDYYTLEGGLPNEKWCLGKPGNAWEVYYSERGQKTEPSQFNSESEALEELYSRLIRASKGTQGTVLLVG